MSNYKFEKMGKKEDFTKDIRFSKIGLKYIQARLVALYNDNSALFKDFMSGKTLRAKRGTSAESDIIFKALDEIFPHEIKEVSITAFFQFNLDMLSDNDIYGRFVADGDYLCIGYLAEYSGLFELFSSSVPNALKNDTFIIASSSDVDGVNLACEELYENISDLPTSCYVAVFANTGEYISATGGKYKIPEECDFYEDVYSSCNTYLKSKYKDVVLSNILVMLNEDEKVSNVTFFTNSNNDTSVVIY